MAEEYVESIIIRQDNMPEVLEPSFCNDCCGRVFEFEGKIELVQILKSVQDTSHHKHDYVFKIVEITKVAPEEV